MRSFIALKYFRFKVCKPNLIIMCAGTVELTRSRAVNRSICETLSLSSRGRSTRDTCLLRSSFAQALLARPSEGQSLDCSLDSAVDQSLQSDDTNDGMATSPKRIGAVWTYLKFFGPGTNFCSILPYLIAAFAHSPHHGFRSPYRSVIIIIRQKT